jgi:hypothetical protein
LVQNLWTKGRHTPSIYGVLGILSRIRQSNTNRIMDSNLDVSVLCSCSSSKALWLASATHVLKKPSYCPQLRSIFQLPKEWRKEFGNLNKVLQVPPNFANRTSFSLNLHARCAHQSEALPSNQSSQLFFVFDAVNQIYFSISKSSSCCIELFTPLKASFCQVAIFFVFVITAGTGYIIVHAVRSLTACSCCWSSTIYLLLFDVER